MSEDKNVRDIVKHLAELTLQDRLEKKEQTGREGRSRNDNTAMSIAEFGGGSAVEAEDWLAGVKLARKVGGWSEDYTRAVLLGKLVGSAKYWYRDCVVELSFAEWEAAFRKAFIPEQEEMELTRMLLNSRQAKGEEMELFARRTANLANRVGWTM